MADKPIPSFILNKNKGSEPNSAPPATEKGAPPPAAGKGAPPEKPEAEEAPPGPSGKPGMPPAKGAPPTDAKTPAPGKGGPQPEGKGAPPEGPPPGPEPGDSEQLKQAKELLQQYIDGLINGSGMDPNALQATEQLINMPETPDPTPGAMSNLVPKGTGGQRMGAIPSPGLPTGQMPLRVSPANPGVQLVGGLPLAQVQGMQMKIDAPSDQSQGKNVKPGSKPLPPGIKK